VISTTQALAARRAMLAGAALGATLAAHAVASGGLRLLAAAPLLWGWMLAAAALCGPRRAAWRPRGPVRLLALLIVWQAAMHLAMTAVPWAFGVSVHHQADLLTPAGLAAHLAAALLLALLLARAERLLAAALGAVAALRRLLAPPSPRRRPSLPAPVEARVAAPAATPRALACRGPPAAVTV
jgi:hypothetical protein